MKILIFEGIATSGKSTLIRGLIDTFSPNLKVELADEAQTHIPIMQERNELHVDFFKQLIQTLVNEQPDVILFDRLYITQAIRANSGLDNYIEIEALLSKYDSMTIFMKVQEDAIADRIQKATEHRESEWGEYVKTRGQSIEEVASYYIEQQRQQLKLLEDSRLPYKVFDTTRHDYERIIAELRTICK